MVTYIFLPRFLGSPCSSEYAVFSGSASNEIRNLWRKKYCAGSRWGSLIEIQVTAVARLVENGLEVLMIGVMLRRVLNIEKTDRQLRSAGHGVGVLCVLLCGGYEDRLPCVGIPSDLFRLERGRTISQGCRSMFQPKLPSRFLLDRFIPSCACIKR